MTGPGELTAVCRCGRVAIKLQGAPIVGAPCYCSSCREAGRQFDDMSEGLALIDRDGGTRCVLFRKDQVRFARGVGLLKQHRLNPGSVTRRVTAVCCQTPLFLDMTKGFWLSVYADPLPPGESPVQMRVMVKDAPPGIVLPNDVPAYAGYSGRFFWKLMIAWARMGFRRPKLSA